jgi:protein disulfide-isomerase
MKTTRLVCLIASLLAPLASDAASWLTDLPTAQAKAKAENKLVLVNFTGSDWCGWCIRLKNEILSKPEFETFANANLVLLEIDFPRRKAQSEALKQANQALAQKFGVQGFPTLVVLGSDGRRVGDLGYMEGGPKPFIEELRKLGASKPPSGGAAGSAWGDIPTAPVTRHGELVLQGISGPAGRRLALINNETLGVGESASVKLRDRSVKVRVVEIKEQSVMVKIDDASEARELKLRGRL